MEVASPESQHPYLPPSLAPSALLWQIGFNRKPHAGKIEWQHSQTNGPCCLEPAPCDLAVPSIYMYRVYLYLVGTTQPSPCALTVCLGLRGSGLTALAELPDGWGWQTNSKDPPLPLEAKSAGKCVQVTPLCGALLDQQTSCCPFPAFVGRSGRERGADSVVKLLHAG